MTNRERVITSLNHRQPDKIPYSIGFTHKARQKMAAYYGDPHFEGRLGNCFSWAYPFGARSWKEVAPDVVEDAYGVRWDRSVDKDIGIVCNRMVTEETLETYAFPDLDDPLVWEQFDEKMRTRGPDEFVVANLGFSLYERAWTLAGMETLLLAMGADPPFAHRLLDRVLEHNLRIIERACAYAIDAMMFGDDWGCQRGVLMGPDLWREYIKPRVRAMYQAAKARGKYVFIHSCGKVDELFPDLIEAGLDTFNPFQPEVIDVYETKRVYGGQLCFYGGISTQRTLPYATAQQTREEVKRLLDRVGRDGGYFAAPAHDIPADAKPENIAAMIDALRNQ